MSSVYLGIDVSKSKLDVATPEGVRQWSNTPEGHAELVAALAAWTPEAIVIELAGRRGQPTPGA